MKKLFAMLNIFLSFLIKYYCDIICQKFHESIYKLKAISNNY